MGRIVRVCVVAALLSASVAGAGGDSPLTKAVKANDVAAVRTLVKSRADVNLRSGDGSTPLLWAAYNSDLEIARLLIAAGAKVDTPNNFGVTPLLAASRTGDAAMMAALLKAGADPARGLPAGETPLAAAARAGSVPAVKLLLERTVDLNAADTVQKTTPLMWAAVEGHTDVVDLLLKAGADPNRQGHITSLTDRTINSDHPTGGFTALMFAARQGNEATVRRLAAGKANLNLKNGDGASAMMIAIYNDRFDMAATLAELGADVNDGSLYVAVEMRESTTDQFAYDGSRLRPDNPNKLSALDLMKVLLEKGADPNKNFTGQFHSYSMPNSDRFDNTPFFRAAITSDAEALKVLAAHGANLEYTPAAPPPPAAGAPPAAPGGRGGRGNPNAGRTAAMVTMTGGRGPGMTGGPGYIRSGAVPYREPGSRKPEDALEVLLKAGANPNAKGPDGATLLHQAVNANNIAMIRALAAAKVDFTLTNRDGLTALDVAEGKQPANAPARGARPGGPAPPAVGGARGRGGRGGANRQEVINVLRELMGLPPAPPSATPAPAAAPEAPGNQPADPADTTDDAAAGDAQ